METLGVVLEPSTLKWNVTKQTYKLDIRVINTSPKSRVISIQKPIDSENYDLETTSPKPVKTASGMDVKATLIIHPSFFDPSSPHYFINVNVDGSAYPVRLSDYVGEACLQLTTPQVEFDEILLNGMESYHREITIVNNGNTAGSYVIFDHTQNLEQILKHRTITNIYNEDQTAKNCSNIEVEDFAEKSEQKFTKQPFVSFCPSKGRILPLHTETITVTITPKRLGTMNFDVPIQLEQGSNTIVQNLKVTGEIIGNIIQLLNPSNHFPISFFNIPPTYYNTQTLVKNTLVNRTNQDVSFSFEISENPIENILNENDDDGSKIEIKSNFVEKLNKSSVSVKNNSESGSVKKLGSFENYVLETKNSGNMIIDDKLLLIEPMQGVLKPKDFVEVTFKFSPRWNASSQGFKCFRFRPPTKEVEFHFKCIACRTDPLPGNRCKKVHFNPHKSETDLPLRIEAISTAADVRFTPSEDFLDLGSCIVGSQTNTTLYVYNASVFLPVVFSFAPLAHYRMTPSEGLIAPRQQCAIEVMFSPKQAGSFGPWLTMEVYGSKHVEGHSENFKVFYKKRIKLKGHAMYGALNKNKSIIGTDIKSITDKRLKIKRSFKSFNMSDLEQLTQSMRNISRKSSVHEKIDDFDVFIYTPDRAKVKEEKVVDFEYTSNDVSFLKSQTLTSNNPSLALYDNNGNNSSHNSNKENINTILSEQNDIQSKLVDKILPININQSNTESSNSVLKMSSEKNEKSCSSNSYAHTIKSQVDETTTDQKPNERIIKNANHYNINNNSLVKDSILDMKRSIKRAREERANPMEVSKNISRSENNNSNKIEATKRNQAVAFLNLSAKELISMRALPNDEKSIKSLVSDLTKPITNTQLSQIKIEPSTLEYGRICVNHSATSDLTVINNFNRAIHFALTITDPEISSVKAVAVIEPYSMETIPITILSPNIGHFTKNVSFTLNGYYESNVTLLADIEHPFLSFSCSEIVLDQNNSLPGDHFLRATFSIINNLGSPIPFSWRSSSKFPDPNHQKLNDDDLQLIGDLDTAFHELDHLAYFSDNPRRDSSNFNDTVLPLLNGYNNRNEMLQRKLEGKIVEKMALMSSSFKIEFLENLIFTPFFIFPEQGEVPAYSSLLCQVVCYPNYNTLLSHNMVMDYASGFSKVLKINLSYSSSSRVYLRDTVAFLHNSPIGLCSTHEVALYNDGEHCSFFKLSDSNPVPGFFIHPSIGKVMPGGSTRLLIIFTPEMFMDFDISVFIGVINGRDLEMRIIGSVSKPWIEVDRDELDFGTVFLNSTNTLPLVIQNKSNVKSVLEFDLSNYPGFSIASNTPSLSDEKISEFSQYCLEANSTLKCWLVFKPEQVATQDFPMEIHINKYSSMYDNILGFKENLWESYENINLLNEQSSYTDFDKLKSIKASGHFPVRSPTSVNNESDLFINVSHVYNIKVKARVTLDPIKIKVIRWEVDEHSGTKHKTKNVHNQSTMESLTDDSFDMTQSNNNAENSITTLNNTTTDTITNIGTTGNLDTYMHQMENDDFNGNNTESNVVSNIQKDYISINNSNNQANNEDVSDKNNINPNKDDKNNGYMSPQTKNSDSNTNKKNSEKLYWSNYSNNESLNNKREGEVLMNFNVFVPNPFYSTPTVLSKVLHFSNTNMHSAYDLSVDLNDPLFLSKVLQVKEAYIIRKDSLNEKNFTAEKLKPDTPVLKDDPDDDNEECLTNQWDTIPSYCPISNFKITKEIKTITNVNNNYKDETALCDENSSDFKQISDSLETKNFESNDEKEGNYYESKISNNENENNTNKNVDKKCENSYLEETDDLVSDNNDKENDDSENNENNYNSDFLDEKNEESTTDENTNNSMKNSLNINNNRKFNREYLKSKMPLNDEGIEEKDNGKPDLVKFNVDTMSSKKRKTTLRRKFTKHDFSRSNFLPSAQRKHSNKMEADSFEGINFRMKSTMKNKLSLTPLHFESIKPDPDDLDDFTADNDTLIKKYSIKVPKYNELNREKKVKKHSKQNIPISKNLKIKFSLKAGEEADIVVSFYADDLIRLLNLLNDGKAKETAVSNNEDEYVPSGVNHMTNRLRSTMEAKGVVRLRFPYEKKKVYNYRILRFQMEISRPMIFFDPPHLLIPPLNLYTDHTFNVNLSFCNYNEDTKIEVDSYLLSSEDSNENIISLNFLSNGKSSIIKKPTSSTLALKVTLRSSQNMPINSRISVLDSYGNEFEVPIRTNFDNTCFSNLQTKYPNTPLMKEDEMNDLINRHPILKTPGSTLPNNFGTPIFPRAEDPNSEANSSKNDFNISNNKPLKTPQNTPLKTVFNEEMINFMADNSNQNNNVESNGDSLNEEDNNYKSDKKETNMIKNSIDNVQKDENNNKPTKSKIVRSFKIMNKDKIDNHENKKLTFKIDYEALTKVINAQINKAKYIKNSDENERTSTNININCENDSNNRNESPKNNEEKTFTNNTTNNNINDKSSSDFSTLNPFSDSVVLNLLESLQWMYFGSFWCPIKHDNMQHYHFNQSIKALEKWFSYHAWPRKPPSLTNYYPVQIPFTTRRNYTGRQYFKKQNQTKKQLQTENQAINDTETNNNSNNIDFLRKTISANKFNKNIEYSVSSKSQYTHTKTSTQSRGILNFSYDFLKNSLLTMPHNKAINSSITIPQRRTVDEMLCNLFEKQHSLIKKNPAVLSSDLHERLRSIYSRYALLVKAVKIYGGCLEHINPEYLFYYQDFYEWRLLEQEDEENNFKTTLSNFVRDKICPSEESKIELNDVIESNFGCNVLDPSNNQFDLYLVIGKKFRKLELTLYEVFSKRAWADFLMQVYKVIIFGHNRKTSLQQYKFPTLLCRSMNAQHEKTCQENVVKSLKKCREQNKNLSDDEVALMVWVNVVLNLFQKHFRFHHTQGTELHIPHRQINNFGKDFQDGLVLLFILLAYIPHLSKSLMSRIILAPKKVAHKYHNILLFCTTLKSLKIFYDIQPHQILSCHIVSIIMLCYELFEKLPEYLSKSTIDFPYNLHAPVQRELQLYNPSKSKINYRIMLIGLDFNKYTIYEKGVKKKFDKNKKPEENYVKNLLLPNEDDITWKGLNKDKKEMIVRKGQKDIDVLKKHTLRMQPHKLTEIIMKKPKERSNFLNFVKTDESLTNVLKTTKSHIETNWMEMVSRGFKNDSINKSVRYKPNIDNNNNKQNDTNNNDENDENDNANDNNNENNNSNRYVENNNSEKKKLFATRENKLKDSCINKKKIFNKNEDGEIKLTKIKKETDNDFSMKVFENETINDFINFNILKNQKKCEVLNNTKNFKNTIIEENKIEENNLNVNNNKNIQTKEKDSSSSENSNNNNTIHKFKNLKTKLNQFSRKMTENIKIEKINSHSKFQEISSEALYASDKSLYHGTSISPSTQIINSFPLDLTIEANSSTTLVINHLSHTTTFESSLLFFYATYHHSRGTNVKDSDAVCKNDTKNGDDEKSYYENVVDKLGTNFVFLLQPSLNSIYYQDTFVFESYCYEPKIMSIKVKNIFSFKTTFNIRVYNGLLTEKELTNNSLSSHKESVNLFAKNQNITMVENETTDLSLLFISLTTRSPSKERELSSSYISKEKKDLKNDHYHKRFNKDKNLPQTSEVIKNFKDKSNPNFGNYKTNNCYENCFVNTILLTENNKERELFYVVKVYVLPPKPMSLVASRETVSNIPETIGFWRCPAGFPIEKVLEIPVVNHARQAAIVLLGKLLLPPREASLTPESAFLQRKIVNFVTNHIHKETYRDILYNVTFSSGHFTSNPYVEIPTVFNQLQKYINLEVTESMKVVKIKFKFIPEDIGLYKSLVTLQNDSDLTDIRIYRIVIEAFDNKGELIVNMFCQVNKTIHQTIPLHNFSPLNWRLKFQWRGHTCFSGKSESFIPAYHTLHYPILFKPMLEGSFDCMLLITNDFDDNPMVIKLYGTGIKRDHEDEFVFRGRVGESQKFVISVPNRTHQRLTYWVKSNLYVVSGLSTISCPPLDCVDYHCMITPMKTGEETGIIAFEATASRFPLEDDDIQVEHPVYPIQKNQPDLECAAKLRHILKGYSHQSTKYLADSLNYQRATESYSGKSIRNDNENNRDNFNSIPATMSKNVDDYHTVEPTNPVNLVDFMGTKSRENTVTNFQVSVNNETARARFNTTTGEVKNPATISNFEDNLESVTEKIKSSIYKNNDSFNSEEETVTLKKSGKSDRLLTISSDTRDGTSARLDSKFSETDQVLENFPNDTTRPYTKNHRDFPNDFPSSNTNMSSFFQHSNTIMRKKVQKLPALSHREISHYHNQPTPKSNYGTLTVWFKVKVIAEPGPPLEIIDIRANALRKHFISLTIPNNTSQDIDVKVNVDGEGLEGESSLPIPKMSCAFYQCCFVPHTTGESTGSITMHNRRIGEFWFQLNFKTQGIVREDLNAGGCFLGQEVTKLVTLDNPSSHRLLLVPFSDLLPNIRWNLEGAFWLESQSSTTLEYSFMPDMIKDYNGIIGFHNDIAGDWTFEVDGFGIDPAKEWKEPIKFETEPFSSVQQMITVLNSSPVIVNATVSLKGSLEDEGNDNQKNLAVFSFADELYKGSLTYKTRVPSMQNLIVKIDFRPEDKAAYNSSCRIYLEKEDKSSWSEEENLTMLQLAFPLSGNPLEEDESENRILNKEYNSQQSYKIVRNDNGNNNVSNADLNKNELMTHVKNNDIESCIKVNKNGNSNKRFKKNKTFKRNQSLDCQSLQNNTQRSELNKVDQSLPQTLKPLQKTKTLDLEKRFNGFMDINERCKTVVKDKKPKLNTIIIECDHREAVQQLVSVIFDSQHFLYRPSTKNYTYKLLHCEGTLTPLVELQDVHWLDMHLLEVHTKDKQVELIFNVVFKPTEPFKKNVILSVEDIKLREFYHQNLCFYST